MNVVRLTGTWNGNTPGITGPEVFSGDEVYTFYNAHVHWSIFDQKGTEHSIRGHK